MAAKSLTVTDYPRQCQGIYAIRNTASWRVYVGSSENIQRRWNSHLFQLRRGTHHSITLQRSWTKHGEMAFRFEILEVVADALSLIAREQHWIDKLRAFHQKLGFNAHPKAGSPRGHKFSPEIRANMSAYRKGKPMPPFAESHKTALSIAWTPERRAAVADKNRNAAPERIAALIARNSLPMSAESRAKISKSWTEERKALLAARNQTPEARARTAALNKSPAARARTVRMNRARARTRLASAAPDQSEAQQANTE
jgi:group I intron endonuclease